MQFNSVVFLLFICLFFVIWPHARIYNKSRWGFMTIMSLVFYGWWDWRFIILILFSGSLDFICGQLIYTQPNTKRLWLALSLIGNLGSLAFFKYTYFILDLTNTFLETIESGISISEPSFSIVLPVGISFYTFQSLSYTLDIYRGSLTPTRSYLHFMSYLTMFPQLVAGPIIRAKELLQQLRQFKPIQPIVQYHGLKLIGYGLFQKTVLADNLGYMVDRVFQEKTIHDGMPLMWVTMAAFSFQIFCDFSGYSLMARGLAKLMGFHFKMNFNHPYLAVGFKDFWTRWHISLSTWFRDYLYIPLGGNRNGKASGLAYMTITMVVSGIWHGANVTFVIWGLLHAIYMILERTLQPIRILGKTLTWGTTMILVMLAWVFFRSDTLNQSIKILDTMFSLQMSWSFINEFFDAEIFLIVALAIEFYTWLKRKSADFLFFTQKKQLELVKVPLAFTLAIFLRGPEAGFIYFQF